MATATKRMQDMPPAGGYKPINYQRIPAKKLLGGWPLIGSYLAMTAGAAYLYYLNCKQVQRDELEMRSVEFALTPMLLAERDRNYLKHLRRNREEESKLMANVEGWVTGTWYGEKIYETSDKLVEPSLHDYYVHTDPKEYRIRAHQSLWS